jgi:hypothetical protein
MPYICARRADIPNSLLQVVELLPNTSHRSRIYEPAGQTKYLRQPQNDEVVTSGAGPIITVGTLRGLAAYLIDNVETGAGDAYTAAEANTAADDIITAMQAGAASTLAAVDALLAAVVGGSSLTGGGSTGSIADVLQILAGGEYVVPVGSIVDTNGSTFDPVVSGALTAGVYRTTYLTGALRISVAEGRLAKMIGPTFEYAGVMGEAVVVYDNSGDIFTSP